MSNKCMKASSVAPDAHNNGTGIQFLPHELLLEILLYLGPPLDQTLCSFGETSSYLLNSERRRTLYYLSQCCRTLRLFFLPLAWEYVDACCAKDGHGECEDRKQKRKRQRNLELKSRGLVENPNLAAYVRIVNVHIVKGSEGEVLSIFAQCLQSLPNVHTLRIAGVLGQAATAIKTAFKSHRFLQIRTIILPPLAHHILSSCPQVKDITCIDHQEDYVFNTISKRCKQVEALDILVYENHTIELVVKVMPNLCRISIRSWYYLDFNAVGILSLPLGLGLRLCLT